MSLRTLLGLYPKTGAYENKRRKLEEDYNTLREFADSDDLKRYEELKGYVESSEFSMKKKEILSVKYKQTEEYRKEKEFNKLSKKKKKTDSDAQRLEQLRDFVQSQDFYSKKDYYTKSSKQRWKDSEEYALLEEYKSLAKSPKLKWYYKERNSKKFDWLRVWNETFSDDFTGSTLDTGTWMTRYYWGDKLFNENYALSDEKHIYTDNKNFDLGGSILRITTKREKAKGKCWDPKRLGFSTREFDYTSGIINTAQSFKQKYGTFEAKLRCSNVSQVLNAFWMVGDKMTPHIDVAKTLKKLNVGVISGDPSRPNTFYKNKSKSKLTKGFFIYTLEWTPNKITWKINGMEIASTTRGVPQEEMYIAFSSGVYQDNVAQLPASFEIDWVRCFQHNDYMTKEAKDAMSKSA